MNPKNAAGWYGKAGGAVRNQKKLTESAIRGRLNWKKAKKTGSQLDWR
jgi:hypothetical protein